MYSDDLADWVSALLILSTQFEQSWLWNSPEDMMLYLVSTSLKLPWGFILTLFLNSSTNSWL
jgi:hypothetical protein